MYFSPQTAAIESLAHFLVLQVINNTLSFAVNQKLPTFAVDFLLTKYL
jgi:hypothetical protein